MLSRRSNAHLLLTEADIIQKLLRKIRSLRHQKKKHFKPVSVLKKLDEKGKEKLTRGSQAMQQRATWMRSFQVKSNSKDQDQDQHMEPKNQQQPYRDVMYDSFGDAYGTRSDEEGFGGVYGRNQELSKENEPKPKHGENHEYDTSQGSEVKEKEKARHQPNVKSE
ncbi:hypothetical protein IHE45_08G022400 [Dioscorea alata]|nr:hypothetical protein IHE45_08G022400 [Dioscorea alata]